MGKDVTVEPFAYIAADVEIGDGCWIGPGAVILDGARLGKNCKVHTAAVVAGLPQDLKFKGEYSTAVVGDNTTIRECATISRGTAAKGVTTVGSNTLIMAYVHVGHDCTVGDNCVLVNRVSLAGEVEVGDWAILGGHCAVHQFCRIGEHVMLSGGSLVSKDVPPFVKAAHNPLSFVGANFIGLRRRGFTAVKINEIQEMFRILFQSGYAYSARLRGGRDADAPHARARSGARLHPLFEARHPEAVQSEKAERRSRVGVFRQSVVSVAPYFGYV